MVKNKKVKEFSYTDNTIKKSFIENMIKYKLIEFFISNLQEGKSFVMQEDIVGNNIGFKDINYYLFEIMKKVSSYNFIERINKKYLPPHIKPLSGYSYEIVLYNPRQLLK